MFAEDLSVFFDAAEFATEALLDGAPVTGNFYEAWLDELDIGTTSPAYKLPSAQAVDVCEGESQLVIGGLVDGKVYTVVRARQRNANTTLLQLRCAG